MPATNGELTGKIMPMFVRQPYRLFIYWLTGLEAHKISGGGPISFHTEDADVKFTTKKF